MSCKYCLPDPSTGEVCPLPSVDTKEDIDRLVSELKNIIK